MKRLKCILILSVLTIPILFSQSDSRNGYTLPTEGLFRIFVVFAEAVGDPNYNQVINGWSAGQLPDNSNSFIDTEINSNYQSYISRYFDEISFGRLQVVGDYYPQLLQIPYTSANYYGVFNKLNELCGGNQLITHNNLNFPDDFDLWNLRAYPLEGQTKQNIPDGYIDCIFVFWRINSHMSRDGGQFYPSYNLYKPISNKSGISSFGYVYTDDITVFQHEFAHGIVGSNQFHSAPQNNGTAMFIEDYPGFSILSGRQLKQITLSERGEGSVTINGSELTAGIYLYALIADGREVDVKRMILTE